MRIHISRESHDSQPSQEARSISSSQHTVGRGYLRIGWMLASGKHVDLVHHLRNVRAKGAEHQSEVPLLYSSQHALLSRWPHARGIGQCQQEQEAVTRTSVLSLCAPHSYAWKPSALSGEAPGRREGDSVLIKAAGLQCSMAVTCFWRWMRRLKKEGRMCRSPCAKR